MRTEMLSGTAPTFHARFDVSEQVQKLDQACNWANLAHGKAARYARLVTEFFAGYGRTQEHVLAYHESLEITEVYRLWKQEIYRFPGLMDKVSDALVSGPLLSDWENPATSTNWPRNSTFVYILAGRLIAAGIDVLAVDGIMRNDQTLSWLGDITIKHEERTLDIQCKRLQRIAQLAKRIKEARKQIISAPAPRAGIIAIDFSATVRPSGQLLPADSPVDASESVSRLLQRSIPTSLVKLIMADSRVLALLAYASVPVMVERETRIVTSQSVPFTLTLPCSVDEILVVGNGESPDMYLVKSLHERILRWHRQRSRAEP